MVNILLLDFSSVVFEHQNSVGLSVVFDKEEIGKVQQILLFNNSCVLTKTYEITN